MSNRNNKENRNPESSIENSQDWPTTISKLRKQYLEQKQKPTWDVYFMAYDRIKMFPEEHLYKLRKDIEINHERVAKETIIDESTIIIDGDNGLSIAEMLERIIRTEEESALEPTTDNRIRLVDVARRLIGQTDETNKLFQTILQIHGKKMKESHTEEEIVVNVHSND